MGKYVEVDRTIETALLLLEEGEDEQTLAYNAALVAFIKNMENVPAADVVEVVRCGECKYQEKGENEYEVWNLCGYRPWLHIPTEDDAFCSKGERKDG